MKKRFLGLLAVVTLVLGLSSCVFEPTDANFYLQNDTQFDVKDWGMIRWSQFKSHNYTLDGVTIYVYDENYTNPVNSYSTSTHPTSVPFDKDETYFPIWMLYGENDIYAPLDNGIMYTCAADSDYTFSLYSWRYTERTADANAEEKVFMRAPDGTELEVVKIGEVAEGGSLKFFK